MHSRLDYANSLLFNATEFNFKKLQRLQNTLARIATLSSYRSSATPLLKSLHWLPIKFRINYKIANVTHNILTTSQPSYLYELLHPYTSQRSQRQQFINTLNVPRTRLKLSDKSFSVAAPKIWNSLPLNIRQSSHSPKFIKNKLKTVYTELVD